jgi:hypothetical protein
MSEYVYGTDEYRGHWLTGEEIVRCRDCKHGHLTIDGKYNKWCSLLATHDTNGDYGDSPDGYDPEPYFDSDFYCAWGERRDA